MQSLTYQQQVIQFRKTYNDTLSGKRYTWVGGPIKITSIPFRKIKLTQANETLVRNYLFVHWNKYFAKRRKNSLREMKHLPQKDPRFQELAKTKFVKNKKPLDLSGACKVSAQLAYIVFPLPGQVITNKRHSFVLTTTQEIYDLNRGCQDVAKMVMKGKDPYEIDFRYLKTRKAQKGLTSWHTFLVKLVPGLVQHLKKNQVEYASTPKMKRLPKWARVIPSLMANGKQVS